MLFRSEKSSVQLPDANKFRAPPSLKKEVANGNFSANSFVYFGGLPSFYSTKLSSLALPSAVFEPRFRGSIRNVVYADDETGRPRRQEVMAYKVSSLLHLPPPFFLPQGGDSLRRIHTQLKVGGKKGPKAKRMDRIRFKAEPGMVGGLIYRGQCP